MITGGPGNFVPLKMADETDWIMRPILAGMVSYRDCLDGSVELVDIARMNDALDIEAENRRRASDVQ